MSRRFNTISVIFALTVSVLCLTNVASVSGQTRSCSELKAAAGQAGWMPVNGPVVTLPKGCQVRGTPAGSVRGRVVDPKNTPVKGVEVSVPGRAFVYTNSKGEFDIRDLRPTERLAVSFSAPGFMNTTKIYKVGASSTPGNGTTVVIWARAKPVSLDAARGGKVSFPNGGGVTIEPDSLVNADGKPVRGRVAASLTRLDVSDRRQLRSMAGDFRAQMSDKSVRMLESFGVFELVVTDAVGRRVNLAKGKRARFDLPIPPALRGRLPRRTRLFSFNIENGFWIEVGEVVLTDPLVYSGTIENFDGNLWNTDNPLDVTCITVKFIDVYGSNTGPIANALVKAEGGNYNAISSGYTNNDGLVCLLVKINSPIAIYAEDPAFPGVFIGPTYLTSPNIISGASDCGDPNLCPLIMTMEQDARVIVPATNRLMTARALHPEDIRPAPLPEESKGAPGVEGRMSQGRTWRSLALIDLE